MKYSSRLLPLLVLLLSACSGGGLDSTPPVLEGSGRLTIDITDSPFTHELVEDAVVCIDQVRVHAADSTQPGWHTIYEGAPLVFDLMDLRNGITRTLTAFADVPAGRYGKIRIRVAAGELRLVNGNEYTSANGTLQLTSTATSGMQITVDPPIEITDGISQTLLLDFDLSKTFHPVPANDPLTATRYQLHKGVRAANLSVAGELRGTITSSSGQTLVENATVYVLPPGVVDIALSVASTASDQNGSWAVIGLRVGTYDVFATFDVLEGRVNGVGVIAGSATPVDVNLE